VRKTVVLCSLILLAGCTTFGQNGLPERSREIHEAEVLVKNKQFAEAATAYKKIVADSPTTTQVADAMIELALVSVYHDNPQKDYAQAIKKFEEFVNRFPGHGRAGEAQSWIDMLKTVLDLKKETEHLSKNIEELKRLDIRHEERRRKSP